MYKGTITYDISYFIKRFRSRILQPVKVIATKEIVYTSLTGLVWNTSIAAIVLGHQYGYRDVICKHSIQTQNRLQAISLANQRTVCALSFVDTQLLKNARNG